MVRLRTEIFATTQPVYLHAQSREKYLVSSLLLLDHQHALL